MKVIIDGFGGDNAPVEILKGCQLAIKEYNVDIIVAGNEEIIRQEAEKNDIKLDKIEIVNAKSVLPVNEDPTKILKEYADSSMAEGLSCLAKGDGDVFISAGSTGGLVVGSTFIVKRIKGIKRPAIATVIPTSKSQYLLIDSGANHDVRPEMLVQFALMGSIYMEKIFNIKDPKVGILNIGIEENKGTELQKRAYQLLKDVDINFIGNVEARELPFNEVEVVVADGFVGNVILKYTEGIATFFMREIKDVFGKNIFTKMAGGMVYRGLKEFKKQMDYTGYGGAILLGLQKPVIKAHGSSNAKAIKNAIRQAMGVVQNKTIEEINLNIKRLQTEKAV